MGPLNDEEIEARCLEWDTFGLPRPMVDPFEAELVRRVEVEVGQEETTGRPMRASIPVVSFGLSSFGYDFRVRPKFRVFSPIHAREIDPKNFDERCLVDVDAGDKGYILIPPHSYALSETVETFFIPRDVIVTGIGKSTYVRCGISLAITPFEPEWEGTATLEITNHTPLPARIYANEGLGQILFFQGKPCRTSYADRKGKYNKQSGIVSARV